MDLDTFVHADKINMHLLAREMPGLVRFETEQNQKNRYQEIQQIFGKAAQQIRQKPFLDNQEDVAWYLTALVECAPLIDKEVFDHYKNLELQYKEVLHAIVDKLPLFQPADRQMICATIRKACDSRMILREKYIHLAEEDDQ